MKKVSVLFLLSFLLFASCTLDNGLSDTINNSSKTDKLVQNAMATGKIKWVGNIWYGGTEPMKYTEYWNQLTPENAGKWSSVEYNRGQYNWSALEAMYNYSIAKNIPFKQHTFVWSNQAPAWLDTLPPAEQRAAVENWIKLYGQKFPNTAFIDVVNEMLHVVPVYKDAIGGNGVTGWDWVVWSFEKARQYCPNAKLLINEFNVIEGWTPVQDYVNIINILKSKGLIDGIGIQCHGLERTPLDKVKERLDQLGATGLPLYVSELDLDFGTDENALKTRYQQLFPVLYEHPAVKGITLWGYIQGHHWRPNAYLMRSDGTERPALTWIKEYLAGQINNTVYPVPGKIEAENYSVMAGVQTQNTTDAGSGLNVGWIDANDWMEYTVNVATSGTYKIDLRVASLSAGGKLSLLKGTTPIASAEFASTGGWQNWTTVSVNANLTAGAQTIRLLATTGGWNINWMNFSMTDVYSSSSASKSSIKSSSVSSSSSSSSSSVRISSSSSTVSSVASQNGGLKVQFYNGNKSLTLNGIQGSLKLVNTGTTTVNLANVKVRYYYTIDSEKAQTFWCDWSTIGSGNVTGSFVKLPAAKATADYYMEAGFTAAAGSLAPGSSCEVQIRFSKNDWSDYSQSNDYSFNAAGSSFADWNKMTCFISGSLKWGIEP